MEIPFGQTPHQPQARKAFLEYLFHGSRGMYRVARVSWSAKTAIILVVG